MEVTFKPKGTGARTTTLRIASNDEDEGVFEIKLTGNATAAAKSAPLSITSASAHSRRHDETSTNLSSVDGLRYLVLTVRKDGKAGPRPLVEVSSDLVNWRSGADHTEVLLDDANRLIVRDRTPTTRQNKRYIRVRWIMAN
jgi:hypothetical protein